MKVTVDAVVEDVLMALGLAVIPAECDPRLKMTDTVEITGEADDDDMADNVIDLGKAAAPGSDELNEILDRETIVELATAIRRGDRREAELMLDRLVAEDDTVTEWVQQARFSRKARRPESVEIRRAA